MGKSVEPSHLFIDIPPTTKSGGIREFLSALVYNVLGMSEHLGAGGSEHMRLGIEE
jgi:hypothetical protein